MVSRPLESHGPRLRRGNRWPFVPWITIGLTLAACRPTEADPEFGEGSGRADGDGGNPDAPDKLDVGGGSATRGVSPEGEDDDCAEVNVSVAPEPPTVMLVVDHSGSMFDDFGGISRWAALEQTLITAPAGLVPRLQSEVRFGLALYTSLNGQYGGTCPQLAEVPPAFDNAGAIAGGWIPPTPDTDTPTGEAIDAIAPPLAAMDVPGAKAIILATDGEPDTCAVPDPQTGQPQSLAAVERARQQGIPVYVVSVGAEISDAHLQALANAGVGLPATGVEQAPFFRALDADALVAAFDRIIGGVVSCTFAIEGMVDLERYCEGAVLLDGVTLECDTEWTLLDESTLELRGNACDTLRDGNPHRVDAGFPCDVIFIP